MFYTLSHTLRQGRVGPGQANSSDLALDPMQARLGHEKSGPTLALLGSDQVSPQANRAWTCPQTVYLELNLRSSSEFSLNYFGLNWFEPQDFSRAIKAEILVIPSQIYESYL